MRVVFLCWSPAHKPCEAQRWGQAARAAGMPLGGGLRSSQTGLEVAMIAPVEEMTWARRKLSCEVETVWVTWPLASCAGV